MKKTLTYISIAIVLVVVGFTAINFRSDIPVSELRERYAYPESQFIPVDGMDVHCRVTGSGPETVVLLHGTSSSVHTWEGWTDLLNPHYRVVSFDLPGFGLTGPFPHTDYSPERYLEFVEKVLNALDVDTFHLAGNSFGGFLAWRFAVEHPERVTKLVLLNSSGYPRGDQPTPLGFKLAMNESMRPIFTNITPRSVVSATVHAVYFDQSKVTDGLIDLYYALLLREGNRDALMYRIQQVKHETADAVKNVRCPTLILWGDHDRVVTPDDAPKFHRDIEGSELIIYEGMGHVPMEEDPQRTMADVLPFLQRNLSDIARTAP
ncbi:MAG: alpha/beta hydrolase [Flavobacteriales bacterium]|nr:alpha/beta hydrolase [Flavobacteriales bacterium]